MNPTIRFGTLYRLQVSPRSKALADPDGVCRSGKVAATLLKEETQRTGKRVSRNDLQIVFWGGDFLALAGGTYREALDVETAYFQGLAQTERFILDKADSEEEAREVLGEKRFNEIRQGLTETFASWVVKKLETEECPTVRIDLDA